MGYLSVASVFGYHALKGKETDDDGFWEEHIYIVLQGRSFLGEGDF